MLVMSWYKNKKKLLLIPFLIVIIYLTIVLNLNLRVTSKDVKESGVTKRGEKIIKKKRSLFRRIQYGNTNKKSEYEKQVYHGRSNKDKRKQYQSIDQIKLKKSVVDENQEVGSSGCPLLSIRNVESRIDSTFPIENNGNVTREEVKCKAHLSNKASCLYASKTYKYDETRRCNDEEKIEICKYKHGMFLCMFKVCWEKEIWIHQFNLTNGHVTLVDICTTEETLITKVKQHAIETVQAGFRFLFLSCAGDKSRTQLLLLDDHILKENGNPSPKKQKFDKLNINIVLLDSVSRSHFYRSLKKTIAIFSDLNSKVGQRGSSTEVFDFELFQALHGHSAENNHGLFTGDVFPDHLTDNEREQLSTGLPQFVQNVKNKGYEFLYQDDMCWQAFWGIRMDLGGAEDYEELLEKIKLLGLYDTGLMFASCKIIDDLYNDVSVFNLNDNDKVCYNGQQQDNYYLQYIINTYKIYNKQSKGLFTYANLNVAHDGGGVRIQTIDDDLANFVTEISEFENTLTIILSDHGNTYTDFVYTDIEGRYEIYHPSLFMIVPESTKKLLGKNIMTALRTNQKRLVTMIDLHHTIFGLLDKNHNKKGLLEIISSTRNCDDLPLRLPNLCVCQGFEQAVRNTTDLLPFLEYGVGMINNEIVENSPTHTCKRLVPIMFGNALEKKDGAFSTLTFDVITASGYQAENKNDKFSIEISSQINANKNHLGFQLKAKERISKFGPYRKCMDAVETFRLCVCDVNNSSTADNAFDDKDGNKVGFQPTLLSPSYSNGIISYLEARTSTDYTLIDDEEYTSREDIMTLIDDELSLLRRSYFERNYDRNEYTFEYEEIDPYPMTVSFEGVNLSKTKKYLLEIKFKELDNMKPVSDNNCSIILEPGFYMYICTISRIYSGDATYDTEMFYEELD